MKRKQYDTGERRSVVADRDGPFLPDLKTKPAAEGALRMPEQVLRELDVLERRAAALEDPEDLSGFGLRVSKISKLCKLIFKNILQIFGGLVLGSIKTKFCKKICV